MLGGTFDPPHIAHLTAAAAVADAFELDRVLFVPTGQPWQKSHYSSAEDRFLMTSLATTGDPRFATSRVEIDRKGPTYTLDTMITLRAFHGADTELFFIAGADAVLQLSTWKGIAELGEYCELIAVTRPGFELKRFETIVGWPRLHTLEMKPMDVSATDIRRRVRERRSVEGLVPEPVLRYIEERGLYLERAEAVDA
ncbi:MAG: nicotinate-nucleotide adenylyltransferase [Actinomycetota bacterium]|nr:nicotinate-nucleotide adenylyltransferase [Actinomycetota bacterium]